MMITGKSATLFGPGFILVIGFLVFFACLVVKTHFQAKRHAMIAKTRSDERLIATLLQDQVDKAGGLTNLSKQFILDSIFSSNQGQTWLSTNAAGDLIDVWQTPFRIDSEGPTNFVVRSAGRNQMVADSDDNMFNSASNDFVKP